jgi:hypothetical protein
LERVELFVGTLLSIKIILNFLNILYIFYYIFQIINFLAFNLILFLKFNLVEGGASLYGESSKLWYVFEGIPYVFMGWQIPLLFGIFYDFKYVVFYFCCYE